MTFPLAANPQHSLPPRSYLMAIINGQPVPIQMPPLDSAVIPATHYQLVLKDPAGSLVSMDGTAVTVAGSIATVAGVAPVALDIPVAGLSTAILTASPTTIVQSVAGISPTAGAIAAAALSAAILTASPTTIVQSVAGISPTAGAIAAAALSAAILTASPTTIVQSVGGAAPVAGVVTAVALEASLLTARSSTWASRGSGTVVGQEKLITDVGDAAGTTFKWDGTNWRSKSGSVTIAQKNGTVASPIDTNQDTGSAFTLPALITIPAGLIIPDSYLEIQALVKRTNANATMQIDCYLGTAGSTSDSLIGRVQLNATDGHVGILLGRALFGSGTTTFVASGSSTINGSSGGGTVADRTTNVNTALAMKVTLATSSANASDIAALLGYTVTLRS